MPTPYVRKLATKHGVSAATAEKHWAKAKAAAEKEGHGEDYGYVTSIFQKMMHEAAVVPSLKDLTNGMTFRYFLIAEAEAEAEPEKEYSPTYKHLADRFPLFSELPFKDRRELEREVKSDDLLDGYDTLSQEEKDSVDGYLHDMVTDKMQSLHRNGANFQNWDKEDEEYKRRKAEHDAEQADIDDASAALAEPEHNDRYSDMAATVDKKKRFSAGPRHIAAMRQQHIPTDRAADAPAGSNEVGAPVKSYYKPWSALSPEQRAARAGLAKKHGTIYRVKNAGWFRVMSPEKQQAVINALKSGADVATAKAAATAQSNP